MIRASKIIDIDKNKHVWSTRLIQTPCCKYMYRAVLHKDTRELECMKCGKMFPYRVRSVG